MKIELDTTTGMITVIEGSRKDLISVSFVNSLKVAYLYKFEEKKWYELEQNHIKRQVFFQGIPERKTLKLSNIQRV